jgi:hypothetical protein
MRTIAAGTAADAQTTQLPDGCCARAANTCWDEPIGTWSELRPLADRAATLISSYGTGAVNRPFLRTGTTRRRGSRPT